MASKVGNTHQPHPYDLNFCFPISLRELSNSRIRLTPFIPAKHAAPFFAASSRHPELYAHFPFGPFATLSEFLDVFVEGRVRQNPGAVLFAIFDKADPFAQDEAADKLAGIIAYQDASPTHLSVELGLAIVLPAFHHTHVARTAIALLLRYALEPRSLGGLGLRRVTWQCYEENVASVRAAQRVGFSKEMANRWNRIPREGKIGKLGRGGNVIWDTVMLAVCWDDWEVDGRTVVRDILEKRA